MDKIKAKHYEELFNRLLERGELLHATNKKRIRVGLIFLGVFTVAMILIRYFTESDRATFLMIWVIGMFATCIYLIAIEYIDDSIEKTLMDVTEREYIWGELIPDSEAVRGLIQDRARERREEMEERFVRRYDTISELINNDLIKANNERYAPEREDDGK